MLLSQRVPIPARLVPHRGCTSFLSFPSFRSVHSKRSFYRTIVVGTFD